METSGATRDRVVIGASAGGLSALRTLAAGLPRDYPGALFVVMHISPEAHSELPALLSRAGPLPAQHARPGEAIEPGRLYIAPPDQHLLVERERLTVVHGPRENRHRPAIDPLFRSAAWSFGPRVVGIVLSGTLDDGTAGLWAVKSCGGTTIVQAPGDAEHPQMPLNAMQHNRIDHVLPGARIAPLLVQLAHEPIELPVPVVPSRLGDEVAFARVNGSLEAAQQLGALTPFTCPTCRGALWELEEGGHLRYRCHTGHAFSQQSLLVEQAGAVEEGLYSALRAVEEKAGALRRLAGRWTDRFPKLRQDYEERARDLDQTAEVLRTLLAGGVPVGPEPTPE